MKDESGTSSVLMECAVLPAQLGAFMLGFIIVLRIVLGRIDVVLFAEGAIFESAQHGEFSSCTMKKQCELLAQ